MRFQKAISKFKGHAITIKRNHFISKIKEEMEAIKSKILILILYRGNIKSLGGMSLKDLLLLEAAIELNLVSINREDETCSNKSKSLSYQ